MCTIAILVGVAAAPVVIAANRDELYARDTRPVQRLAPGVVGGLDVQSGGTWLAVHRAGRFAAVTNQRALAQPIAGVRSRGLAVRELAAAPDQDRYLAALDPRGYASMNLVWGSAERVSIAYLRHDGGKDIIVLPRGIHVLCNDRLEAADFPRGDRLARALDAALADAPTWDVLVPRLSRALADHTRTPLAEVPASPHLPAELARELTATCIHSEHYGTRSSTVAAFESGRVAVYLHADGPPCTTPLVDRRELLT
jgi:uncharacterized protein with NRDE domain